MGFITIFHHHLGESVFFGLIFPIRIVAKKQIQVKNDTYFVEKTTQKTSQGRF